MQSGNVARNALVLAANFFQRVRLQVERVVMRDAAAKEHQQHRFRPRPLGRNRRRLFRCEQTAKRKAKRCQRSNAQEVAPRPAVAEPVFFRRQ